MILDIVESIDGIPIRLTDERWEHILVGHQLMSGFMTAFFRRLKIRLLFCAETIVQKLRSTTTVGNNGFTWFIVKSAATTVL